MQRHANIGEVERLAAPVRLVVERCAVPHEGRDVGDRVADEIAVPVACDVHGLVEIAAACRIDRHERNVGRVLVRRARPQQRCAALPPARPTRNRRAPPDPFATLRSPEVHRRLGASLFSWQGRLLAGLLRRCPLRGRLARRCLLRRGAFRRCLLRRGAFRRCLLRRGAFRRCLLRRGAFRRCLLRRGAFRRCLLRRGAFRRCLLRRGALGRCLLRRGALDGCLLGGVPSWREPSWLPPFWPVLSWRRPFWPVPSSQVRSCGVPPRQL